MSRLAPSLGSFELLREMGDEQRGVLGEFLEDRDLDQGQPLFYAGHEAAEMLLIVEGSVQLLEDGAPMGTLPGGEVLGAVALVSIGRRECTAVAAEPTRVLALDREGYLRLRQDHPQVALLLQESVLRQVAGCLRGVLGAVRQAS